MFKFKLGLQVKDTVTGFVGVIAARGEFHNRETVRTYLLVATDATGCPCSQWCDESTLVLCYGE